MSNKIIKLDTVDVRFPTSDELDGSDATNKDPDYSASYVIMEAEDGSKGYGLIFTIGRGNDLCCLAVESLSHLVLGLDFEIIKADIGAFYNDLRSDSQLRWLGPEKGVIHMAIGAVINTIWDMWARSEKKPLWRLLSDMTPEQFVACLDFRYISDALTRDEALQIVRNNAATKQRRIRELEQSGFPAYTTSPGWMGYNDDKLKALCADAVEKGFRHVKLKVGESIGDDVRRCKIARDTLGSEVKLMVDANQKWEVDEAIHWMKNLDEFSLWFIEEPTSPDDIYGHKKIRENIGDVKVATGEHCHNRIMFKQFIENDALDIVQIDACRLAGLNEVLTVYMLAAKYGKPVCPHAGGVGLCEYVQHLAMIDYVMISGEIGERVVEYVDHLHEHFEDPCQVRNGAYIAPNKPGFSIKLLSNSVAQYRYPDGSEWISRLDADQEILKDKE